MIVSLHTIDGCTHVFESAPADPPAEAIPCFLCGVCCERWQPLIDMDRASRIADWLGKSFNDFIEECTESYPLHDEQRLIRRGEDGACIFLVRGDDGLTSCGIHAVRPNACRGWEAGLDKKECRQGLTRLGNANAILAPLQIYEDQSDAAQLIKTIAQSP